MQPKQLHGLQNQFHNIPLPEEKAYFIFHASKEANKLSKTDFELDICNNHTTVSYKVQILVKELPLTEGKLCMVLEKCCHETNREAGNKSKVTMQHKTTSQLYSSNIDLHSWMSSNEQIKIFKHRLTKTPGALSWSTTSSRGCFALNISMVTGWLNPRLGEHQLRMQNCLYQNIFLKICNSVLTINVHTCCLSSGKTNYLGM